MTGGGKRILLVESNRANADLVSRTFREFDAGLALSVVGSTEEARRAVRADPPDLAVIDLVRPAGSEAIDLLQEGGAAPSFPVVILTDRGDQQSAVAAIKAGALDFVVKTEATLQALPQIARRALAEWEQRRLAREAEDALRRSQARYKHLSRQFQTLLDGIPDVLLLLDRDLKLEWVNRAGRERFGLGDPLPAGGTCHRLFHGRDRPCDGCPVAASFASGRAEDSLVAGEDGAIWGVKAFPLLDVDGTVHNVIGLASEITEKIRLRSESLRASQMATLGELAAGVAHEINNPANGIINYAQLLRDRTAPGSREQDLAGEIIDEGTRIARTVKNLLSFAHTRGEDKRPVAVRDILAPCLELTGSQLKKEGIALRVDLPDDLPPVRVMVQPIQQVILNLINNSRYALNEKYPPQHPDKQLLIRGSCQVPGVSGEAAVRLEITDRGIGIPENMLTRVMDPFFTTKPADRGTGLGLSMSREIVLRQGGQIQISSLAGESTTVLIDLPAASEGAGS